MAQKAAREWEFLANFDNKKEVEEYVKVRGVSYKRSFDHSPGIRYLYYCVHFR